MRARQMGEALYARINPRHELSGGPAAMPIRRRSTWRRNC